MKYEIKIPEILFWNVDTQYDFMRNDESFKGALHITDAGSIEPNLERLTKAAQLHSIPVVNTADWHTLDDAEISDNPDYNITYPKHCMAGTYGAGFVPATEPENPYILPWQDEKVNPFKLSNSRNIVLYKNDFDVFKGNPHTRKVLSAINPDVVIVYGVATNVCVNYAVQGLIEKNKKVYVVKDAIKELPKEQAKVSLDDIISSWQKLGVRMITTEKAEDMALTRSYLNEAMSLLGTLNTGVLNNTGVSNNIRPNKGD